MFGFISDSFQTVALSETQLLKMLKICKFILNQCCKVYFLLKFRNDSLALKECDEAK